MLPREGAVVFVAGLVLKVVTPLPAAISFSAWKIRKILLQICNVIPCFRSDPSSSTSNSALRSSTRVLGLIRLSLI